ncbi:MAG TPA: hypothetical protein VJ785_04490 [Anaerolineales bacterium]|nr:hypothetical protein [Anaerolineales bacterium]
MITESFFTFACAGLIGLLFGTALTFAGYRLFLFLLPIWGFFFGLTLGAQAVQVLFGDGFLSTVTSWMVGFVVALVFALLSYVFYAFAVAIISGSLGYALAVGLLTWIGLDFGLIVWLIGIVAAVALAIVTLVFNIQKWVIIAATSIMGAGTIFGTILLMFNPAASLLENPVQLLLSTSVFLTILFLVVAGLGIYFQFASTRSITVVEYNRMNEINA